METFLSGFDVYACFLWRKENIVVGQVEQESSLGFIVGRPSLIWNISLTLRSFIVSSPCLY